MTGCNRYSGKATFRDGSVKIGAISVTEKACLDAAIMKQETSFLMLLGKVSKYELKGSDLMLSDGTTTNVLHFTPTTKPPVKSLTGTKWILDGFEESDGNSVSMTALVKGSSLELTFGKDGRLSGSGGINRYFGAYKADAGKGKLEIGGIGSTKMGGPPELMKQESKYFGQLQSAARFEIVGGRLILKDEKQEHALLFKAAAK